MLTSTAWGFSGSSLIETGKCLIYACHGTVRNFVAHLFIHFNLLDQKAFTDHLAKRSAPYVDLPAALQGEGDALTIDDATQAAAEAATIARENGHAVTLFVNPLNVECGLPYFFARLNVLLDLNRRAQVEYVGAKYPLEKWQDLKRFREAVKGTLCTLANECERQAHVSDVAHLLDVNESPLPEHFRSLSVHQLQELASSGVRLENHGWTHSHPAALDDVQYAAEIQKGKEWLATKCNSHSLYYAVPFGTTFPRDHLENLYGTYFLLDSSRLIGRLEQNIVNRASLRL